MIEDIILQGDIHSDGAVRIMENASVLGNIFAEKDILLEKNATVLGNIFTQGNIIFEEGASVIPKSQFFGCRSLEKVCLPESVSVIEDYAFADCHVLKVWESMEKLSLKSVGISAVAFFYIHQHRLQQTDSCHKYRTP